MPYKTARDRLRSMEYLASVGGFTERLSKLVNGMLEMPNLEPFELIRLYFMKRHLEPDVQSRFD